MFGLFGSGLAAAELERKKRAQGRSNTSRKKGHIMRALFSVFPLLAIPVIIYNIIAFTGAAAPVAGTGTAGGTIVAPLMANLNTIVLGLPMISGVTWQLTGGDALVLLAIALLFLEILKSTSTGTATIMNHAISLALFIICIVEFLMHPNFATSAFFIIMVMTLLDVLAGVVVTIVSARRDFAVGEGFGG